MLKKPVPADQFSFNDEIESSNKAPKFKVGYRVRIKGKGYTKNWSREILVIDSVLKTDLYKFKIKDLNGEK